MIDAIPYLSMAHQIARRRSLSEPRLREEVEGEAVAALCEAAAAYEGPAEGFEAYALPIVDRAAEKAFRREKRPSRILYQPRDHERFGRSDEARSSAAVSLSPPKRLTPGQKRRLRRNVVIAAAHRQGCSQRLLAEVFDLPRSRIGEIVVEMGKSRPIHLARGT